MTSTSNIKVSILMFIVVLVLVIVVAKCFIINLNNKKIIIIHWVNNPRRVTEGLEPWTLALLSKRSTNWAIEAKACWWMYVETTLYKVGVCLGLPNTAKSLSQSGFRKMVFFGIPESCSKLQVNILKDVFQTALIWCCQFWR